MPASYAGNVELRYVRWNVVCLGTSCSNVFDSLATILVSGHYSMVISRIAVGGRTFA